MLPDVRPSKGLQPQSPMANRIPDVRFFAHNNRTAGVSFSDFTKDSTWFSPRSDQGTSDAFRRTMRSLPHSVAVVTALAESPILQPSFIDPATDNVELLSPYFHDFCGVTISSLQSVTLGPPAIISFNLKLPSRTLSGLLHHKHFGVHLLLGNHLGQEVADAFVQQPHHKAFRSLSQNDRWIGLGLSPIEKVEDLKKRVPLIRGRGVFSFLRCEMLVDKSVQVEDHMIVIAKVASIGLNRVKVKAEATGLAYVHGEYRGNSSRLIKPKTEPNAKDITIPIQMNSLRIHSDALGTSTLSMESTLAEFCQQVQRELPEDLQGDISRFLLRDKSWAVKAIIMQDARESHARGESPTLKGRRDPEWRKPLHRIYANFRARCPSNFWENPPENWPSTSPPWDDGINRLHVSQDVKLDFPSHIKIKSDKDVHDSRQDGQQSSTEMRDIPKSGSDPLGATGEEDDGDLSSLTEEGCQTLTKKLGK